MQEARVSAGLVSCFHVPFAYFGQCSTKATKPLPLTLKTLPTSGALISPREEKIKLQSSDSFCSPTTLERDCFPC